MRHFYSFQFSKNGIRIKVSQWSYTKIEKNLEKFGKNLEKIYKKNILYKNVYYYYQEFQIKPNLTRQ